MMPVMRIPHQSRRVIRSDVEGVWLPELGFSSKISTAAQAWLAQGLLCLAFFILIFSNDEQYAVVFQFAGVMMVVAAAVVCIFGRLTRFHRASQFDILVFLMVFFSFVANLVSQNAFASVYTLIFAICYLSIAILVRSLDDKQITRCAFFAIFCILAVAFLFNFGALIDTLQPGAANRWELRYAPFNMHPDLAGFVYGGFIVLIAFSEPQIGKKAIYVKSILILMSVLIIMAASARAGLLAVIATMLLFVTRTSLYDRKKMTIVISFGVALLLIALFFFDYISRYFSEILELDSSSRGIDSGGSGRFELWQQGISLIASRSWDLLIGSGLRSATEDVIGFYTENSYITITIESGILIAGALVIYIVNVIIKLAKLEKLSTLGFEKCALYCLFFCVVQSIFNRYLLAIGNPMSLFTLIVLSKYGLEFFSRRRSS